MDMTTYQAEQVKLNNFEEDYKKIPSEKAKEIKGERKRDKQGDKPEDTSNDKPDNKEGDKPSIKETAERKKLNEPAEKKLYRCLILSLQLEYGNDILKAQDKEFERAVNMPEIKR